MLSLRFYLDTRHTSEGEPAPLKLMVNKRSRTGLLKTGISLMPDEWDAKSQAVIKTPRRKVLNSALMLLKTRAEDWLRPKIYNGELAELNAQQIRDLLDGYLNGAVCSVTFGDFYGDVLATKRGGTAMMYRTAWAALLRYDERAAERTLDSLTPQWAEGFVRYLRTEGKADNTVNNYTRQMRTVWNIALRKGIVSRDIFAEVKTHPSAGRKRDLTADQLRTLWVTLTESDTEALALDFFRLSFLLRAINISDLFDLRDADMYNGRIYYKRNKTGKEYSVKVEPEAAELIARRRGHGRLFDAHRYRNALVLTRCVDEALHSIGARIGVPALTTYWARHTLASLLFERGESMDTVSYILGHSLGGAKVTATYVNVKESQGDRAIRSLLDWLDLGRSDGVMTSER